MIRDNPYVYFGWSSWLAKLFLPLIVIFTSGLSSKSVSAELMVLYPEVKAPFSKVFEDISEGARSGFKGDTTFVELDDKASLQPEVNRKKPDVVLALGKRSLLTANALENRPPLVLGAVNSGEYAYPGIVMIPDPEVILDRLLVLSSGVKRVHVVQKSSGEDLQLMGAVEYLKKRNVELIVYPAEDIREAASIYAEMLDKANSGDAVWILQDGSYVNSAIFSLLLDAAWNKNLVVFSSNPLHVKHGALFAVYPDNKKMGASLGKIANEVLAKNAAPTMHPLRDVLLAVNERTGSHLGISLSNDVREQVDLILPAR